MEDDQHLQLFRLGPHRVEPRLVQIAAVHVGIDLEPVEAQVGVGPRHLADRRFFVGDAYSIADVATWPWVSRFEWHGLDRGLDDFPHVKRWYSAIAARPAVRRGYDVPATGAEIPRA